MESDVTNTKWDLLQRSKLTFLAMLGIGENGLAGGPSRFIFSKNRSNISVHDMVAMVSK
jgi:hypothetical protein